VGLRSFREQKNGNSFDDRVTMTARADQVPVSFFENLVIPRADQELQQFLVPKVGSIVASPCVSSVTLGETPEASCWHRGGIEVAAITDK
jgi:hypothetical protein